MSSNKFIPLSVPTLAGNEWKYIKECLDTNWVSSVGSFVNDFERVVAEYTGSSYAIATVNGTAALHVALKMAGVTADDYVIAPNLTFVATLNAVHYTGATPILIDAKAGDWQMDLDILEEFLEQQSYQKEGACHLKSMMTVESGPCCPSM